MYFINSHERVAMPARSLRDVPFQDSREITPRESDRKPRNIFTKYLTYNPSLKELSY